MMVFTIIIFIRKPPRSSVAIEPTFNIRLRLISFRFITLNFAFAVQCNQHVLSYSFRNRFKNSELNLKTCKYTKMSCGYLIAVAGNDRLGLRGRC